MGRRPVPDDYFAGAPDARPNGAHVDDSASNGALRADDAVAHEVGQPDFSARGDGGPRLRADPTGAAVRSARDEARRLASVRSHGPNHALRFLVFALLLAAIVVGGLFFVGRPLAVRAIVNWGAENRTALSLPFVSDLVRGELGPSLNAPAGTDPTPVSFIVTSGESPREIADALLQAGLLKDATAAKAFVFQSIASGADAAYRAGPHQLARTMTPLQIIAALQAAAPVKPVVKVLIREGLRIEQVVAKLESLEANPPDPTTKLTVDPNEFYKLATNPPASLTAKYQWLVPGKSLEGFLFPATYDVYTDTTAEEMITMMLDAFQHNAPADLLTEPAAKIYQTMQIASLVELEVKNDADKPKVAGVYVNRLDRTHWPTGLLNSNPSVTYAVDSEWLAGHPMADWVSYTFWVEQQSAKTFSEMDFPPKLAGYNTYRSPGLPPTPLCSPGIATIEAAMNPDTKDGYYYFLATPDGTVVYAHTLDEQVANQKKYGLTP